MLMCARFRHPQCEGVNLRDVEGMALLFRKTTGWLGADVCIDCVGCEAGDRMLQTVTGRKMKLQARAATVSDLADPARGQRRT